MNLYEKYAALCAALRERECESCGGPAQHVDPDGSTFCFDCAEADGPMDGTATYPGFFRRVCGNCGRPATVIDQRGDSWCDACADEEDGDAS